MKSPAPSDGTDGAASGGSRNSRPLEDTPAPSAMAGPQRQTPTFGYLDALEDLNSGVSGGYLIVTATGRPLEFHCTAPVLASRAQQILFGPSLRPHLLGERVGGTLVERAAIKPTLLLVTDPDFALAAATASAPLALVSRDKPAGSSAWRVVDAAGAAEIATVWTPAPANRGDDEQIVAALARLGETVEVAEPFERIREAIREAQRLGQGEAPARDAA